MTKLGEGRFEDFGTAFSNDSDDVAAKISKGSTFLTYAWKKIEVDKNLADFGKCFEKRKKSLEKDALKVKQATARHTQSEREIMALDVEEMKKFQAEITAVEKETDGLYINLKSLAADYQKAHKSSERELLEAENEFKRSLQTIYNEAAEFERAQEEAYKVFSIDHFVCFMVLLVNADQVHHCRVLLWNARLLRRIRESGNKKSIPRSKRRKGLSPRSSRRCRT